jgi:AcrR family transcriptional regulator
MIEISAAAEVSRATLYNHFRDKGSIFRALLESELERVFLKASSNPTLTEALATLSREISADPALATMRTMDPALLTTLCSDTEDPLWEKVRNELISISRDSEFGEMVIRWLVGQVFHPLSLDQSVKQSSLLTSR